MEIEIHGGTMNNENSGDIKNISDYLNLLRNHIFNYLSKSTTDEEGYIISQIENWKYYLTPAEYKLRTKEFCSVMKSLDESVRIENFLPPKANELKDWILNSQKWGNELENILNVKRLIDTAEEQFAFFPFIEQVTEKEFKEPISLISVHSNYLEFLHNQYVEVLKYQGINNSEIPNEIREIIDQYRLNDMSPNKENEKLVYLDELGVLDYLKEKWTVNNPNHFAELLSAFMGIDPKYLSSEMRNWWGGNYSNSKSSTFINEPLRKKVQDSLRAHYFERKK